MDWSEIFLRNTPELGDLLVEFSDFSLTENSIIKEKPGELQGGDGKCNSTLIITHGAPS